MKTKSALSLLAAASFTLTLSAQVPNSGFENWTSGEPDGWLTNNIPGIATPITQTTPGHGGSSAVKGEVVTSIAGNIPPSMNSTDSSGTGFPVTQPWEMLNFYYKLNATNTGLIVAIYMIDSDSNLIGTGWMVYTGSVSAFTHASIPITYTDSNPAQCYISIYQSDTLGAPNVGDYFIIDDMTLAMASSGTEELPVENLMLNPNPANSDVAVHLARPAAANARVLICDLSGRVMKDLPLQETDRELVISVADLPGGVYVMRIIGDRTEHVTKLVKN